MRYATLSTVEARRTDHVAPGERRLLRAVLEDALRTILAARHGGVGPAHVRRERAWLTSRDRDDPFAFESICDALDLDAGWIRRLVLDTAGARIASLLLMDGIDAPARRSGSSMRSRGRPRSRPGYGVRVRVPGSQVPAQQSESNVQAPASGTQHT
jgi:hypothetical protein